MPGTTQNFAWRYPLPGERALADATQKLAYDMDATFTATDTLRTQATHRPAGAIYATVTQSLTKATRTKMIFDTVAYDTDTMANLGTSNDRLTIKTAGLYYVHAQNQQNLSGISTPTSGVFVETGISKNGTTTALSNDFILRHKQPENSTSEITAVWGFMLLAVADFVEVWCEWGGSAVAGPLNASHCELSVQLICRNP